MDIQKILIANRGEIAVRIIKTCKQLGISTVAIYSEADKGALFLKLADEAYFLGEPEPQKSYLNIPKIIEICKKSGVDAVHPGYGFLSENETFSKSLQKEGIVFIGPSPESIRIMGDKVESRKKMMESGVPVVPGYNGESQDLETLLQKGKEIGFPLMIKASAGGGGKGMKKVDNQEDFEHLLESAKREAKNAFGNDRVFLERYITSPRHIEFQIFGDTLGNVVHLYERDCSVQRRHQKIIEESPGIDIPDTIKQKMGEIAILAAKSIEYVGAGTVEFIYEVPTKQFYFLEMNTRLQVEHPVTEMVTGLDLVEWQIHVAEGKPLPFTNQESADFPKQKGHAIEVRIYAEDPENNFSPSVGKIHKLHFPEDEGIRLDTGVENHSEVNIYYDPMLAKLIVYDINREFCLEKLIRILEKSYLFGVTTNISYLKRILSHPEFKNGNITTHFIQEHTQTLEENKKEEIYKSFALCTILHSIRYKIDDVWNLLSGFQFWDDDASKIEHSKDFVLDSDILNKGFQLSCSGYEVSAMVESFEQYKNCLFFKVWVEGEKQGGLVEIPSLEMVTHEELIFSDGSKVVYYRYGLNTYLHFGDETYYVKNVPFAYTNQESSQNTFYSQMPGKVIQINSKVGDSLKTENVILVMEAMKMENAIRAHSNCLVDKIHCKLGDMVGQDELLVEVKPIT